MLGSPRSRADLALGQLVLVRAQHKTELRHTLCCVGACHSGMHAHIITYLPARPCGSACRPNHAPVYYRRGHIDQAKKIVAEIGRELGRTRYAGRSACRKEVLRGAERAREWAAMWAKKGEGGRVLGKELNVVEPAAATLFSCATSERIST